MNLQIENKKGIVTVTINRPQAMNAINSEVMEGLHQWFGGGYKEEGRIKGVIITGAGDKAFAAGADIKEFTSLDEKTGMEKSKFGQDTYFLIERFHRPVIAAVNGFALGGGCELAMACHMRYASSNARFGQPEVNLGLLPGYGATQRLCQLVGKSKAFEMLLTATMIDAMEAWRIGLVNHVVEGADLMDTCTKTIEKISTKGPTAIAECIHAVNAYYSGEDGYAYEHRAFGKMLASDECKEGVSAFIEKRKPNF